jgi:hypothetical protein
MTPSTRSREEIIARARRVHDESGCSCDRRYIMSCPRMTAAVLAQGREEAENPTILTKRLAQNYLTELVAEIRRQDERHPDGYPATRDGIRLGIAAAEDEVNEALDAWRTDRCKCPTPLCGHATWEKTRGEALQAAAVLMRLVWSIDEGTTP